MESSIPNQVKYSDEPSLFEEIEEFAVDSVRDHRRGSNFFRIDIIEFKPEHKDFFPEIVNFEQYLGTWKTDQVIWDDDYGFDSTFSELTRVEKREVVSYEWVKIQ